MSKKMMNKINNRIVWDLHRDDLWFDEVHLVGSEGPVFRIYTLPRYKTSGLSGDEWRTSAPIEYSHNGKEWTEIDYTLDLKTSSMKLFPGIYSDHHDLLDVEIHNIEFLRKGRMLYRSDYDGQSQPFRDAAPHLPIMWHGGVPAMGKYKEIWADWFDWCFQPGCSNKAVSTYQLKFRWCRQGHKDEPMGKYLRRFCKRHLRRGDCGLEDADANYEIIEGPGPNEAAGWEQDESPSAFGGIVRQ